MSCNKFSNKCARGIGILSKNQPKFDLMPSHGFWSGRLNVASVENRTAKKLLGSTQSIEKKVIFYYQDQADLTPILFPGTPVTHVHVAAFHVYRDGREHCEDGEYVNLYSDVKVHLNDEEPLLKDDSGQYVVPEKFQQLKTDIDEMHNVGIKVILMLGGAGGAFHLLLCALRDCEENCRGCGKSGWPGEGGELTEVEEKDLVEYFKSVISLYGFDGIDFNIEDAHCIAFPGGDPWGGRPESYNVLVKLVKNIANGKEDFIVCVTPKSVDGGAHGTVLTDATANTSMIMWYQNLVKELAKASLPVTYMNMQMYSGSLNPVNQYFGDGPFDSVVGLMKQLGLSSNRAVLGQVFNSNIEGNIMTTQDGFEGALKAYKNRKDEFGGMFSWEYAYTAPYQPGGGGDPSPKPSQLYWAFQVQSVL